MNCHLLPTVLQESSFKPKQPHLLSCFAKVIQDFWLSVLFFLKKSREGSKEAMFQWSRHCEGGVGCPVGIPAVRFPAPGEGPCCLWGGRKGMPESWEHWVRSCLNECMNEKNPVLHCVNSWEKNYPAWQTPPTSWWYFSKWAVWILQRQFPLPFFPLTHCNFTALFDFAAEIKNVMPVVLFCWCDSGSSIQW